MDQVRDRKAEHIQLAIDKRVQSEHHFFDGYAFEHKALPEVDYDEISLETPFLGKILSSPLLISCMTGGTEHAEAINHNLAIAAGKMGIAIGVGSQRKAIENPELAFTFQVRDYAPDVPVLANLGAVQLNYGYGLEECERVVEMVHADALVLHLNPLQEAIQPEGQRNFAGLFDKINRIASQLSVPVIVKEVGSGISYEMALRIKDCGVNIIDTAGTGGTSWARIEAARADDEELGELFANWGLSTPDSIQQVNRVAGVQVIGSGGIRSGVDVAKAIAMGADLAGVASPVLVPALESADAVVQTLERFIHALKIAMFCTGSIDLKALQNAALHKVIHPV